MNSKCNNEVIIGKSHLLVAGRIQIRGLMFKKVNLILIFQMISDFNIQVVNSL